MKCQTDRTVTADIHIQHHRKLPPTAGHRPPPPTAAPLAFAVLRLRPPAKQQIQFLSAAYQRRQHATTAIGVEAAFGQQGTLHPLGVNRLGDPIQVAFAQIGQFKHIADQSTGRGGDDDLVGRGQSDWACYRPPAQMAFALRPPA